MAGRGAGQGYRLLYRVRGGEVEILAFIHAARDLAAMLKED